MIVPRLPGPLTIHPDDTVTGLIHPAEFERREEDPETGEWKVVSCIRLPTRADVFMRGGVGHFVYADHPPLKEPAAAVIDYYDGLAAQLSLVHVDAISFEDDGAHIVGRFADPGWELGREMVTYGYPSCDWRAIDGELALVGGIIVIDPGFNFKPIPSGLP